MRKPTIEEILAPKLETRPRIYAYSINDKELMLEIKKERKLIEAAMADVTDK